MAWAAGPRARGGRGPGQEPAERARAAKDRIARALEAVGPGLREILEHVCFAGSALEAAERGLGLPRRSGKTVLKLALQRLAAHYGIA
jgi:DNA-directed RNA polymerase specialized sigma24 family protein